MSNQPPDVASVLSKIVPTCEPAINEVRKVESVANSVRGLVERHSSHLPEVVGIIFGGSYAKGTWLRGDRDIDLFVLIDPSVDAGRFEQVGKEIGLQSLRRYRPYLRYSDHPYVEAWVQNTRINVVPCYRVEKGKWKSAADRSPYHTQFIAKRFDEEKKRQARLLKKFLKGLGIYGAEIATSGFSGYVSEVLVEKYRSFEKVLQAIANLKERQLIYVEYGDSGDANSYDPDIVRGFQSPVIILDPVDPRRNLGTAISPESVGKFIMASRAFLERPSEAFFSQAAKSRGLPKGQHSKGVKSNLLVVEFSHKQMSPDILWGQLKKSTNAISKQLEIAGFTVLRSSCIADEKESAVFAFLLESMELSPYTVRKGPDVFRRNDSASFVSNILGSGKIRKVLTVWVDGEMRTLALVPRKEIDARTFVRDLLTAGIKGSGVTKGIATGLKKGGKGLRIYSGNERKLGGLARDAVDELLSTDKRYFFPFM